MTVSFEERDQSREIIEGGKKVILHYRLIGEAGDGYDNATTVLTYVLTNAPTTFDILGQPLNVRYREQPDIYPISVDTVTGRAIWDVQIPYTYRKYKGDSAYAFDTTGGTQHITQSNSTRATYGDIGGGAIGFDGERVQGCDIVTPVYSFSERHYFWDDSDGNKTGSKVVDDTFKANVFALTGRVNNAAFRNFSIGEVLFMGVSGDRQGERDGDMWVLNFSFSVSPNRNDIMVGDLGPVTKYGWDYMWVRYGDGVSDYQLIQSPVGVAVEVVYRSGSFSVLNI